MEKLKLLVLSFLFLSTGIAYEKEIGPIAVKISNDRPRDDLKSRSLLFV